MTTLEKIRAEIANLTCDYINGMVNQYAVLQIIDKYAEPTTLDKIKAEIEQIKPYELPWDKRTPERIRDMALDIIDKYAEQEPTTRQKCENCKILELLVDFELETICEDDDKDFEYCENYCHFKAPTKECYLHWAEHKRKAVSK